MFDPKRAKRIAFRSALALVGTLAFCVVGVVVAGAQPKATGVCSYEGKAYGDGERVCHEGYVHVCDGRSSTWNKTDEGC